MPDSVIQTYELTCLFGPLGAVDHLTFQVERGEIFSLCGPEGAGKTTVLHLLLGLIRPTAGRAKVLGHDVAKEFSVIREQTGSMLDPLDLYTHLSAEDNLELYGRIWRLPQEEGRHRSRMLLRRLGLWERREERVGSWNEDFKRRLALARAFLRRPALILLDAPTDGLGAGSAVLLRRNLVELSRAEGTTILFTTRSLAEAEAICDRIGFLRRGRLVAIAGAGEMEAQHRSARVEVYGYGFSPEVIALLQRRQEVAAVYVQEDRLVIELMHFANSAPLVTLLVESGAQIEEVRKQRIQLEDLFSATFAGETETM